MYLVAAITAAAAQLWRAKSPRMRLFGRVADVYERLHERGRRCSRAHARERGHRRLPAPSAVLPDRLVPEERI
jgi:hypothetical protein